MKIFLFSLIATVLFGSICFLFWKQELQYVGPTPKPEEYREVSTGEAVDVASLNKYTDKILFVHFYNSNCPCSRFNIKEFRNMVYKHRDEVNFIAIIQSDEERSDEEFKSKYDLAIPAIRDEGGTIAEQLGVYSTPQAVLIKNDTIFYRGNYNRARFCTTKNTKFAQLALQAALNNKQAPQFPELAFTAYGCELPSNTNQNNNTFNFFDL